MTKPRVYVDTSVLGGCFDPEFARWSNRLVKDFHAGRFVPVLSDLLVVYAALAAGSAERISVSPVALALLQVYEKQSVLGSKYRADMLHIALATVANVDVLVSWNFKHIVRFDKIRLFNAANLQQGYKLLAIHSPREVSPDE